MLTKQVYRLLALTCIALAGTHCGTSVTNPTPSPSSAPVVAAFTTTSGTSIGTTGTTDVPIASAFSITFSTAMTTSTLTTSTLTLSCSSSSQTVTVTTVGNNAATVTPASSMPEGATCIFTATTGVQSAGGVAMASAATFTFTTVAGTPTVSSVTGTATSTGSSATIATTGTTGISGATAAPLTTTFSTAMSSSTVTGGMTLQCGGTSQTVTNAASSTTAFTTTPSSALPQMASCVLTLPATIQSSSGGALAATTYTYATGCGTSDDFSSSATFSNSSTICWTPTNASNASTFAISGGVLDMTIAAGTTTTAFTTPNAQKIFPSTTSSIVVTTKVTFSGINTGQDGCTFSIRDSASLPGTKGVSIAINPNSGAFATAADFGSTQSTAVAVTSPIYFRLSLSGGVITASYSTNGTTFTAFDTTFSFASTSGSILVDLSAGHTAGASTTVCQWDDFTVTGATATGQYSN